VSYPILLAVPGMKDFAEKVDDERARQLKKWGDQIHPDIDPRDIDIVTRQHYEYKAGIMKGVNDERETPSRTVSRCSRCQAEGDHKHTAWDFILLEEVYEALTEAAAGDLDKLETELIQCGAVIAAWVYDIRRRKGLV
jgi:hypothetical protein